LSGLLVCTSHSERRRWILGWLALGLLGASDGALSFKTLAGATVSLHPSAAERGVILHFWATWCPTCVEEMESLDAVARECRGNAVRLAAVNVGEDADEIDEFVADHRLELEMLRDPRGKVWRKLSGQGLPLNVIWTVDDRRVLVGPKSLEWWQQTLASLGCAPTDSPRDVDKPPQAGLPVEDGAFSGDRSPPGQTK